MRKMYYVLAILVFAALVAYKASVIRKKETGEIVSISQIWQRTGKPVDVLTIKKGRIYCREKVSGVVTGKRNIAAEVPPEKTRSLQAGQKFSSISRGDIKGRLASISGRRDIVTGLVGLSFVSDRDIALQKDSIVPLKVETGFIDNSIRIPSTALTAENGSAYCWVCENGLAVRRTVRQGLDCDGEVQILKGLKEGDMVCTNGVTNLSENDKVMIRKQVEQ
ncbi:MAG: hypothetical protein JW803_05850 [Endomicrobiales bacterium]|nr:hypothetical protein [Endomicrobiales bacterium]